MRAKRVIYLAVVLIPLLAGCKGKEREIPPPLPIKGETECRIDGMILLNYPGPKAQIHYRDGRVDFFCETKEPFQIYIQPGRRSEIVAFYVQDAARIDWKDARGGWIDAREAIYVVGSSRKGSMGPTYAPFRKDERDKAVAFMKRYGGRLMTFDELIKWLEGRDE